MDYSSLLPRSDEQGSISGEHSITTPSLSQLTHFSLVSNSGLQDCPAASTSLEAAIGALPRYATQRQPTRIVRG